MRPSSDPVSPRRALDACLASMQSVLAGAPLEASPFVQCVLAFRNRRYYDVLLAKDCPTQWLIVEVTEGRIRDAEYHITDGSLYESLSLREADLRILRPWLERIGGLR